ncbi:LOB domain-containing protein 41 [Linum grandiflorum]
MRMSCNGCRVLRKGCSDNCSIRPCLQWIKSPDSQAHATVFLAKFYGRAGLMNLINAGPDHLRPAIFRSLLYEACGRIVNPIYGSVGLLWSGSWHLCQAAVEAVLKGDPITPINSETAFTGQGPPFKAYDIRHVTKDDNSAAAAASNDGGGEGGEGGLLRVKPRSRVRRLVKPKPIKSGFMVDPVGADRNELVVARRSTSHESSVSHQSELAAAVDHGDSKDSTESMVSVETAEASLLFRPETESAAAAKKRTSGGGAKEASPEGVGLELTLGLEPMTRMTMVGPSRACHVVPVKKRRVEACEDDTCKMELGLDYPA